MHRFLSVGLLMISMGSFAATILPFKDNHDVSVTLSRDNFNRLVIKNDRILEYFFPEKSIEHRVDEDRDGLYIIPVQNPVTVFVTTEKGHHFSINISTEEGLGKTYEFVAQNEPPQKPRAIEKQAPVQEAENPFQHAIIEFIQKMEKAEKPEGVSITHPFNKVERLGHLTLIQKEIWKGVSLEGEIIELFNNGRETLTLDAGWFNRKETLGVKFSKDTLAPKERVLVYRVKGEARG